MGQQGRTSPLVNKANEVGLGYTGRSNTPSFPNESTNTNTPSPQPQSGRRPQREMRSPRSRPGHRNVTVSVPTKSTLARLRLSWPRETYSAMEIPLVSFQWHITTPTQKKPPYIRFCDKTKGWLRVESIPRRVITTTSCLQI